MTSFSGFCFLLQPSVVFPDYPYLFATHSGVLDGHPEESVFVFLVSSGKCVLMKHHHIHVSGTGFHKFRKTAIDSATLKQELASRVTIALTRESDGLKEITGGFLFPSCVRDDVSRHHDAA